MSLDLRHHLLSAGLFLQQTLYALIAFSADTACTGALHQLSARTSSFVYCLNDLTIRHCFTNTNVHNHLIEPISVTNDNNYHLNVKCLTNLLFTFRK